MRLSQFQLILGLTAALTLAACGGGGGGSASSSVTPTAAKAGSTSSGTITAFGSVFVNGHEFSTASAKVSDDDANASSSTSGLEVGMTVDVKAADDSNSSAPHAGEIHIHPLARGTIDWSDPTAGTLQVMGQTVALSATTVFRDDRSCVANKNCTAINGQSGLVAADLSCAPATTGTGFQAGSMSAVYAQVFGLVSVKNGVSSIHATLVRLIDPGTSPVFKAEGDITAVGTGTPPTSFAINNLTLDTSVACASANSCAYTTGTLVAAVGTTAPTVTCGATGITVAFKPNALHTRHGATLTPGATVELEGMASNVVSTTTPATFILDGVTIQVGGSLKLPAAGDHVEVLGTVNADLSVTASSIEADENESMMASTPFLMQDTLASGAVVAGTAAGTYDLSILGQHVMLDSHTRYVDLTSNASSTNPFNSTTAATYLNTGSPTVVVVGYQDTSVTPAVFHALGVAVIPATTNVRVGGRVTTAPGTGSTLTLDGNIAVSVSSATTVTTAGSSATVSSIANGDLVLVTMGSETKAGATVTGVTATAIKDFQSGGLMAD